MPSADTIELRERIFQIAVHRFRESGYESVPVSRITREAGIAKGTFFNHFPSKDHVLAEALHRVVTAALADVSAAELAGTEAVMGFAQALLTKLAHDRRLSESVVLRLSLLPPPRAAPEEVAETGEPRRDEDRIRTWIEHRLAEALPVAVPLAARNEGVLALALLWLIRGTLDEWVRGTETIDTLRDQMHHRLALLLESAGLPAPRTMLQHTPDARDLT